MCDEWPRLQESHTGLPESVGPLVCTAPDGGPRGASDTLGWTLGGSGEATRRQLRAGAAPDSQGRAIRAASHGTIAPQRYTPCQSRRISEGFDRPQSTFVLG